MRYKRRYKKKGKTQKQIAWDWMSRWVRLKAVIETCENNPTLSPDFMLAECYTCGALCNIKKKGGGQAGHFRSRGHGGSSGLYFDERAIRLQCAKCNGFDGGRPQEFREQLVREYGEETVRELERLHKLPSRWGPREYPGLILYYKAETQKLLEETGIQKWW
jgi:hypothetical protein